MPACGFPALCPEVRMRTAALLLLLVIGCSGRGPSPDSEGLAWSNADLIAHLKARGIAFQVGEVTPLISLRENAIAKEPGLAILSAGGVCLDSALQWWRRLPGVFPAGDS